MSNQPAPTSPNPLPGEVPDKRDFKKVWEDAVKSYNAGTQPKKKQHHRPGLISPPVDYRTADQVIKHFESQKELFKVFRSSGEKVRGVLTPIVDILLVLKEGAESASDLVTGGDTILGAIGSLLEATKGVSELYDAVEALLKEVLASLKRFKIHFEEPATPRATLKNIIVDALVQVLMVLALATKYCNLAVAGVPWYKRVLRVFWRRAKDYFLVLTDKADVQGILEELRTLANKEEQLVIAATHADGRETKANVAVVKSNVDVVKSDVEIVKPKVAYVHNKAVIDDLRLWLRPPNEQPSNYERKRQTGSCEWFFDENYEDWKAHGNKVYWVHGNPGAGKSVLSSSVIDKVGMDPTLSLAYFYFDFSDLTKQDCVALASSLVFQLGTTCSQECLNYLQRERTNSPPNYDKLLAMLSRLLALSGRTFIIVDALDECPEPARNDDKLLRLLKHLCDQVDGDTDLHLLITSRPAIDIRERISPRATYSLSFHNEVRHTTELARFISTQVSTNKPKWWSVQLQQQVQEKLYERSTGMFLWVNLQLQRLWLCLDLSDVERVLKDLPSDLNATYDRILKEFVALGFSVDRARRVFESVAFAKCPLSPAEVAVILSSNFASPIEEPVVSKLEAPVGDPEAFIFQNCPRLLHIVSDRWGNKIVQFIHFSALEYLISRALKESTSRAHQFAFDEDAAHLTLGRLCLSTLVVDGSLPDFRSYADRHWIDHISSRNDNALGGLLFCFLHLGSTSFTRWAQTWRRYAWETTPRYKDSTALHTAAELGLCHHVTKILESPHGGSATPIDNVVRVRGRYNETALHTAARSGHAEVARILLKHGALVNDTNEDSSTALHLAARDRHLDIVRVLLDHPAEDEFDTAALRCRIHGEYGRTALHRAAKNGHAEIALVLLSHGALVDDIDESGSVPLHLAAYNGRLDVLRLLLEHRAVDGSDTAVAQCSVRDKDGRTALHDAANMGHFEACRVLLEHGALADATDNDGNTPLECAEKERWVDLKKVKGCHPDVARVLLEYAAAHDGPVAPLVCLFPKQSA